MQEHLMAFAVVLAIVLDVAMIICGCRYIARFSACTRHAHAAHADSHMMHSEDAGAFEMLSDERWSDDPLLNDVRAPWLPDACRIDGITDGNRHRLGPVVNPASGLPMWDGMGVDVAGNPYGTDLSEHVCSGFDAVGSGFDVMEATSHFGSGFDAIGPGSFGSEFSNFRDG